MNLLWLLGLVFLSVEVVKSERITAFEELQKRAPNRKLCGNMLSQALFLVCNGRYSDWKASKRTIFNELPGGGGDDYAYEQSIEDLPWPYLNSQALMMYPGPRLGRHRRSGKGIVEECCRSTCSVDTLQSYCAE